MINARRYMTVASLYPGLILGDELLDKQGHLLLPAGTKLTQAMINSLSHHDVQQVSIVDTFEQNEITDNEKATNKNATRDRLANLFRHLPDNAAGKDLMGYIYKYRMEEV
jgi:hypothetical protein